MPDFLTPATELFEFTRSLRRDFHAHPELGFQEVRTAAVVARELKTLGLEVATGIGKTGVVALLAGEKPGGQGRTVMARFDMDALPIAEETGAEYASQNLGVMHACGHDGHTAIGLTVARMLVDTREAWSGTVKFVFQPAEEGMGGAPCMIADGVLENPRPDLAVGLHLWNDKPVGWLGIAGGPVMAAAEIFRLRVTGKGGHGAAPHQAIDPVLAAAQIVTALQGIVSRNVSPLDTAVITVATIHGGEAFNVIPPVVEMSGTIRTFETGVRRRVLERFRQVVHAVADACECQVALDMEALTPAVFNHPQAAAYVRTAAGQMLPDFQVETRFATMGSEDMAFFLQEVPGCFFFVGSANADKGLNAAHHHPRFDFDEGVLPQAAALMAGAIVNMLEG
ncbi:MAG: M20 metallopeptidase family protein [Chloroflexota bacterium]